MEQYYRIAGLTVKMDTFGRTAEQAEPYRTEPCEPAQIVIQSCWPRVKADNPHFSDSDGEYLATSVDFYRKLIDFDGLMLHSSAVVVDGKAYLFTANSGTGKSTHTKLWLEMFGERAFILNDDKPALRMEDGAWYAYGTPWSGKHDISANERVPVAGIAVLERAEENSIAPFGGLDAIQAVIRQVNKPKKAEYRAKLLKLLDKLLTDVPTWKLQCNMLPEAAKVAYSAMSQSEE